MFRYSIDTQHNLNDYWNLLTNLKCHWCIKSKIKEGKLLIPSGICKPQNSPQTHKYSPHVQDIKRE